MKHEIIYTDDYALIVSDENIKDVRLFMGQYHLEKGQTINKFPNYLTDLCECKLIIAHRPLTDAPILEGVPLLPKFSQEEDVEKLSDSFVKKEVQVASESTNRAIKLGFIEGYNKAKETYKYTEEDLINFSNFVTTNLMEHSDSNGFYIGVRKVLELFKQIQKPKRPKYFTIKTTNMNLDEIREQGKGFLHANTDKPVIITNSQGQRELVGTYEGGEQ